MPPLPLLTTHYSPLATLLTTHYSLLATHYSLLTTHYTTHYSLLTTHYSLLTTHYSLLTTHYSLLTTLEAAPPFFLTAAEARQLATEEGLTLETTGQGDTGFVGVVQRKGGKFMGRVWVGNSRPSIGSSFACAEGAALVIARTKASVEMKEKSAADALEAAHTESSSTPVEALGCDMLLPVARAEAAALPQGKDSSGTSTPSAMGHSGSSRPRGGAGAMGHGAMFTTHYSLLTTHYTTHYSLLATHYSLLTTHYSLLTTHYSLHYSLLATRYLLLTTHYSPLHYSLLTAHCPLLTTRYTTHYSLLATHYSLLTTPYTTHYSLLATHYSLLTTHYSPLATLLTTRYSLLTTHYSLLTTRYTTHYSLLRGRR